MPYLLPFSLGCQQRLHIGQLGSLKASSDHRWPITTKIHENAWFVGVEANARVKLTLWPAYLNEMAHHIPHHRGHISRSSPGVTDKVRFKHYLGAQVFESQMPVSGLWPARINIAPFLAYKPSTSLVFGCRPSWSSMPASAAI